MFCIAAELLRPDAPQASGLDSRRAVFAEHHSRRSAGRARARGEAFRQGKRADAGMRERGQGQRDSVRTANARRERGGKGAYDGQSRMMKRGRAVRKLRVERRIKNGLRMLTQAAVSPQRRRTISASSGKRIPVPRPDAGSDARGSCARSARWRPSGDRCIHGRACRTRLLFCRCGGDSRS